MNLWNKPIQQIQSLTLLYEYRKDIFFFAFSFIYIFVRNAVDLDVDRIESISLVSLRTPHCFFHSTAAQRKKKFTVSTVSLYDRLFRYSCPCKWMWNECAMRYNTVHVYLSLLNFLYMYWYLYLCKSVFVFVCIFAILFIMLYMFFLLPSQLRQSRVNCRSVITAKQ